MVVDLPSKFLRHAILLLVTLAAVLASSIAVGAAAPASAAPGDAGWDPTLPQRPSSGAPGDPVAIANASFQASAIALQTTKSLGQQLLSSIGLGGAPAAATGGRVRLSLIHI